MHKTLKMRRLFVEILEDRQLLAGGGGIGLAPVPVPRMLAITRPVPVLAGPTAILPGATVKLGEDLFIATNRNKGMLKEIDLLPADGSDRLAGNIAYVEVWANLKGGNVKDGPRKDKFETLLSRASPDWQTDVVYLQINRALWVSTAGVSVEYLGKFNAYLNGDAIGIATEMVAFGDLRGNYVPDSNVTYWGNPVLHNMLDASLGISQREGKPFSSVSPHETWKLLEFNIWSNHAAMQSIDFSITNSGNIVPGTFLMAEDTNWDGNGDNFWVGKLNVTDPATGSGTVTFTFDSPIQGGSNYWITGYSAQHPAADNTFQMGLTKNVSAIDSQTGLSLKGFVLNGEGSGQVQQWRNRSTLFALVEKPTLVIVGGDKTQTPVFPTPANSEEELVIASFEIKNITANVCSLSNFALSAEKGDVRGGYDYLLWAYDTTGTKNEVGFGMITGSVVEFVSMASIPIPGNTTVRFEVTAMWSKKAYSDSIQVRLEPTTVRAYTAFGEELGIDKVYYWLGENPWYTFGDDGGKG